VRLVALLIKHSGDDASTVTKVNLLNKVLGLICGTVLHDIEKSGNDFFQLPYHRIIIMLFLEVTAPEAVLEAINVPVMMAFTQSLHLLRPSKCSGFAYAWLDIISHRAFIGRMLAVSQPKGWTYYSMLMTDLFKFMAPFLRNAEMSKSIEKIFKGTLRVILVLLHDFPEFLSENHYTFCDAIPPNCMQLRNMILSAYPRSMRLPDPFHTNLKIDELDQIRVSPRMNENIVIEKLLPTELFQKLDSYLKTRTPVTFLTELRGYLQNPPTQPAGMRYNMQFINALVMYVGMKAVQQLQQKALVSTKSSIAHSAHMDIFQNLAVDMDTEGRYLFLNAMTNHLRYPNAHTHYFSCTLLYLFAEANNCAIQEQITRVLLERLISNRPHPWGLLITFMELLKDPVYDFANHDFIKYCPDLEKSIRSAYDWPGNT